MSFSPPKPRYGSRGRVQRLAALSALALLLSGCGGGGHFTDPPSPGSSVPGSGGGVTGRYAFTDLGTALSTQTVLTGISDSGMITGFFTTSTDGSDQPFRHMGATPLVAADALALPAGLGLGGYTVDSSNINASGVITGAASAITDASLTAPQNAFVYDTSFHNLGSLPLTISGPSLALATALNDAGTIVGYDYYPSQASAHAFRHTGAGPLTAADDLGTFGSYTDIRPIAINQAGVIVGTASSIGSHTQHAFVYDTSFHDLGTLPGCTSSAASGINSSGVIIGYGNDGTINHSFRHTGTGPLTAADDLGQLPGSPGLVALAINAAGDIVGNTAPKGGAGVPFIAKAGGAPQSLNSSALPAGAGQLAVGINSKGQIIGETLVAGGDLHPWLLTPTP